MFDPWRAMMMSTQLWMRSAEMMWNAGFTIAARSAMMARAASGGTPWPAVEMMRMVTEKQTAALAAMTAALGPYHRATRSNARRLARHS